MPPAPKLATFPAIRGALKFYQICSVITGTMLLGLSWPFPIDEPEVLRTRILAGAVEPLQNRAVPAELAANLLKAVDDEHPRGQASPGPALA